MEHGVENDDNLYVGSALELDEIVHDPWNQDEARDLESFIIRQIAYDFIDLPADSDCYAARRQRYSTPDLGINDHNSGTILSQ